MNELDVLQAGYKVTRDGHVFSVKSNRYIKETVNKDGYVRVTLSINGKVRTYLVHRLVAVVYVDNPNNYPEVNHKDENKENNSADNLEWCTSKYNNNYGSRKIRYAITKSEKSFYNQCGVGFHKRDSVWFANIRINGVLKHLGYFTSKQEAIVARKEAEEKYYGKVYSSI